VAALMIWHVFRPIRPWFSLPEPVEESEPKPNKTFKRFALGIVLPLALASIFPLFPVYDAIHPVATLYPASAQARADLSAALKTASQSHKRILLDFGANWCSDCRTINRYLQDAKNQPIVDSNFIHVRVNIYAGETSNGANANQDLADQYKISLDKSLPALAVLSDRGELIYGQKNGEFEDMHHLNSSDLTEFLLHWKP
jgi:protein disulfide-isomerase